MREVICLDWTICRLLSPVTNGDSTLDATSKGFINISTKFVQDPGVIPRLWDEAYDLYLPTAIAG
ncbi:hypothetical protein BD414DRAFT_492205 [Trametes punicea]|nr:hypothetical protein BD414DRAFT_492205 [Trametes punicea]